MVKDMHSKHEQQIKEINIKQENITSNLQKQQDKAPQ